MKKLLPEALSRLYGVCDLGCPGTLLHKFLKLYLGCHGAKNRYQEVKMLAEGGIEYLIRVGFDIKKNVHKIESVVPLSWLQSHTVVV